MLSEDDVAPAPSTSRAPPGRRATSPTRTPRTPAPKRVVSSTDDDAPLRRPPKRPRNDKGKGKAVPPPTPPRTTRTRRTAARAYAADSEEEAAQLEEAVALSLGVGAARDDDDKRVLDSTDDDAPLRRPAKMARPDKGKGKAVPPPTPPLTTRRSRAATVSYAEDSEEEAEQVAEAIARSHPAVQTGRHDDDDFAPSQDDDEEDSSAWTSDGGELAADFELESGDECSDDKAEEGESSDEDEGERDMGDEEERDMDGLEDDGKILDSHGGVGAACGNYVLRAASKLPSSATEEELVTAMVSALVEYAYRPSSRYRERLKRRLEADRKKVRDLKLDVESHLGWGKNVAEPAPYPVLALPKDAKESQEHVTAWLDGRAGPLHFADDLVNGGPMPAVVQKVLNLYHRVRQTAALPDLVRQICAVSPASPTVPAPAALHLAHNVRKTAWGYNAAKRGGLELVTQLVMIAVLDNGEADRVAGLLCRIAEHQRASARRNAVSVSDKAREMQDWAEMEQSLDGRGPWAAQLPAADVEAETLRYTTKASKALIDEVHANLLAATEAIAKFEEEEIARLHALGRTAVKIPRTACGRLPALMFSSTTRSRQLAHYIAVVAARMELLCNRNHPRRPDDDAAAVLIQLVRVVLWNGYERVDGTIGVRCPVSLLPLSFAGISHHPLTPTMLSHREHDEPMSIRDGGNVCFESWHVNLVRGYAPFSSLVALFDTMLPQLQKLRDSLVGSVFTSPRQLDSRSLLRLKDSWGDNFRETVERALADPKRAEKLGEAMDAFRAASAEASATSAPGSPAGYTCDACGSTVMTDTPLCQRCRAKERTIENAFAAEDVAKQLRKAFQLPRVTRQPSPPPPPTPTPAVYGPLPALEAVVIGAADISSVPAEVAAVFVDELPQYYRGRSKYKRKLFRPGKCRCQCGCDKTKSRTWARSRTKAGQMICIACYRRWRKSVRPKEKKPARVGKPRGPERTVVCHNEGCRKQGGNTTQWHPVPGVDGAYYCSTCASYVRGAGQTNKVCIFGGETKSAEWYSWEEGKDVCKKCYLRKFNASSVAGRKCVDCNTERTLRWRKVGSDGVEESVEENMEESEDKAEEESKDKAEEGSEGESVDDTESESAYATESERGNDSENEETGANKSQEEKKEGWVCHNCWRQRETAAKKAEEERMRQERARREKEEARKRLAAMTCVHCDRPRDPDGRQWAFWDRSRDEMVCPSCESRRITASRGLHTCSSCSATKTVRWWQGTGGAWTCSRCHNAEQAAAESLAHYTARMDAVSHGTATQLILDGKACVGCESAITDKRVMIDNKGRWVCARCKDKMRTCSVKRGVTCGTCHATKARWFFEADNNTFICLACWKKAEKQEMDGKKAEAAAKTLAGKNHRRTSK